MFKRFFSKNVKKEHLVDFSLTKELEALDKEVAKLTATAANTFKVTKPLATTGVLTTLPSGTHLSAQINGTAAVPGYSSIGSGVYTSSTYTTMVGAQGAPNVQTSIVSFYKPAGGEVVRLDPDGTVTWANGINVDEAAEAFARSIRLGAELQAGITRTVKHEMRDSVFNDLIEIAKERGTLTAADLTSLLEASKIVEKLKGGRD